MNSKISRLSCGLLLAGIVLYPDPCVYPKFDHTPNFNVVCPDDIIIQEKIDGGSNGSLTSQNGSIINNGKVDGSSSVSMQAPKGNCMIKDKIDGGSIVNINCGGEWGMYLRFLYCCRPYPCYRKGR
jgi:hypothetical protein